MKIIKVKISRISREEFFEFLKQVAAIIAKADATKLNIKGKADDLVALFIKLQAALDKEKSSEITKLLNDLDRKRDILTSAFVKWLQAMSVYPDDAIAKDATTLLHYVEGFGKNIATETDLAETTILSNIVAGFTNDAAKSTALTNMHGTAWITGIKDANDAFASEYNKRIVSSADNSKTESFTVVRKQATDAYIEMIELLISRYKSDKEDAKDVSGYEACMNELNTLIMKVNILAETSVARKKSDDATDKDAAKS